MPPFRDILPRIWYEEDPGAVPTLRGLLKALSVPYGVVVEGRNRLYDRGALTTDRLPCPVLSVGNLVAGGTGKTPMTLWAARVLREEGRRPAILSRGYGGGRSGEVQVVSDGAAIRTDVRQGGDEPFLMASSAPGIPVLTGRSRFMAGQYAISRLGADVLVLDDGFQHRSLRRNMDCVLLDANLPFGNGALLPAGPLREPPSSLGRAHVILLTGAPAGAAPAARDWIARRFPGTPVFAGRHRPTALIDDGERMHPPSVLAGKRVAAFAGIARPGRFRQTIVDLGGEIACFRGFPDHHRFTAGDMLGIRREAARSGADVIVTTEKDAVRLASAPEGRRGISALRIVMEIEADRELRQCILAALSACADGRGVNP